MPTIRTPKPLMTILVAAVAIFAAGAAQSEPIDVPSDIAILNCKQFKKLPKVIRKPGIYCVWRNLHWDGTAGFAIEIRADNVTLNFNGYTISGVSSGSLGTGTTGIYAADRRNINIRNGMIRGFNRGIHLAGTQANGNLGARIGPLRIVDSGQRGIFVSGGSGHVVRGNQIANTGSNGEGTAAGIVLHGVSGSEIGDNTVSGVEGTRQATGIHILNSGSVAVTGNAVLDTRSRSQARGIFATGGGNISVVYNRVLNPAGSGTVGLGGNAASLGCFENVISGYATPHGCTAADDNEAF